MNITIEVTPDHWWIERRSKGCEAMVRFKGKQGTQDYDHEERKHFDSPLEAAAWVLRMIEEPTQ